jgi:hypothetical protein
MSSRQRRYTSNIRIGQLFLPAFLLLLPMCFLFVLVGMVNRSITARQAHDTVQQVTTYLTTNDGLQQFVTDFFTEYDAEEMIQIIACESHFKHFNDDGTVLKNKQGSSATGISQILASVHPDPRVIAKYNRRNHTNFKVEDFDVSTLTGNVWYALVLYKTRGTKDWECSNRI